MIMGFKTKLVAAIGGGFLVLLVIAFFVPPEMEYTCYTDFKFQYNEKDYVNANDEIRKELLKSVDDKIVLPSMSVYSISTPQNPSNPEIYTLRFKGEFQENSTEMLLIRDSLEKIPEIFDLSGPSIWCPPK